MQKDIFDPEKYIPGNDLALVSGGEPFFTRAIQLIQNAQSHIHFQVYIFEEDETGKAVAKALKQARQRGVEIYLAVDSYGSKDLSDIFVADMLNSGIHFKSFSPLPKHYYLLRLGRRLHNKVIVADNSEALVGGINIADKYRGSEQEAPWLDFAVWIKGPVCDEISRICERIYREKYFGKLNVRRIKTQNLASGNFLARFALNDWYRRKNQISDGYRSALSQAEFSITIMASYFLPSRSLRRIIKNAARRGVKVAVFLPGESDLPMAKRATRYLYHWLFRHNINIYEWHNSILHGKMAVVDGKWATIGSYNLNHLSQYSSIEMNIEVLDPGFCTSVQKTLSNLMHQAKPVSPQHYNNSRGAGDKLLDWGSYTLARWIMRFLYFLVLRDQQKER